jgi:hypothetical protein
MTPTDQLYRGRGLSLAKADRIFHLNKKRDAPAKFRVIGALY